MEATLRKYGGDATHDQWGMDTARELGLPLGERRTSATGAGIEVLYANAPNAVSVGDCVSLESAMVVARASADDAARPVVGVVIEVVSDTTCVVGEKLGTFTAGYDLSAFDGLPWSLHWAERDVVGEVLPAIPPTAPVTRSWLTAWTLTVDLVAATNAPWWLCLEAVLGIAARPFDRPPWCRLEDGLADALAERITALSVVVVGL